MSPFLINHDRQHHSLAHSWDALPTCVSYGEIQIVTSSRRRQPRQPRRRLDARVAHFFPLRRGQGGRALARLVLVVVVHLRSAANNSVLGRARTATVWPGRRHAAAVNQQAVALAPAARQEPSWWWTTVGGGGSSRR